MSDRYFGDMDMETYCCINSDVNYFKPLKIKKINKTRKDRLCEFCEKEIKKGDSAYNYVFLDLDEDGNKKLYSYYLCNNCGRTIKIP